MIPIRKILLSATIITMSLNLFSYSVLANDYVYDNNSDQNAITRSSKIYYKYKMINGKKYKRLWSDETQSWIDTYWTPA